MSRMMRGAPASEIKPESSTLESRKTLTGPLAIFIPIQGLALLDQARKELVRPGPRLLQDTADTPARLVELEPPRRPEPPRVSSSAAARSTAWKFGLVGARDRKTGTLSLIALLALAAAGLLPLFLVG